MRKSGWWLAAGLCAAAMLMLSGCGKGVKTATTTASSGEPYVIGAMFAITGDASSLGVPEANTAKMLEKELNAAGGIDGHPVRIVIEDTKGDPAEAMNAVKRLVEKDKALAIVGPTRTGETMAVVNYVEQVGVPMLSCALGIEIVQPAKKWVFKTPASDRAGVERIGEFAKRKNLTRLAVLSDNTSFGKSGLKELEDVLPPAGIRLVAKEEYGPKDVSMEAQLTRIKASGAQAVVCWGTPPGPAIAAKQMKQLALSIPLICSQGVANDQFLRLAGDAANGTVVAAGRLLVRDEIPSTDPQKQTLVKFAEAYEADARTAPDVFAGHAWDAIQLVAKALREVGPDREKIRTAIENTHDFVGIDGVFSFSPTDHCGLTKDSFVLIGVKDGKWSLLQ